MVKMMRLVVLVVVLMWVKLMLQYVDNGADNPRDNMTRATMTNDVVEVNWDDEDSYSIFFVVMAAMTDDG